MIIKTCKKHGDLKESECRIEYSNGYKCYRCIYCRREKDQRWKLKNRDKHHATASRARNFDRTKVNKWVAKDRLNNPEKYRIWAANYRERHGKEIITKEICRTYDLSRVEYDKLIAKYDNKCAICKKEETCKGRKKGTIKRLSIDHCHLTNKVRGLLCDACNKMLGHAQDSIEILELAIGYLIQYID
jgi:Recombination endonuclease VII